MPSSFSVLYFHKLQLARGLSQCLSTAPGACRVYNDAAVLQRTAELYLHLLRQAPSMLDGLLREMQAAAAQLGGQQAEEGARVVPGARVTAAGGQDAERDSMQSRQAAALLHFDLELVALLLLGPADQAQQQGGRGGQPVAAGQPQLMGAAEQQAGGEARWQADVPSLWCLLHGLLQPTGADKCSFHINSSLNVFWLCILLGLLSCAAGRGCSEAAETLPVDRV